MYVFGRRIAVIVIAIICSGLSTIIFSCKSDDNSTNNNNNSTGVGYSITINGAGMTNRKFEFGIPAMAVENNSFSIYVAFQNKTNCATTAGVSPVDGIRKTGRLFFPGKTTGTFTFKGIESYVDLTLGSSSQDVEQFSPIDGMGSITITEYGAVGGKVKGTFSGTFSYRKGSQMMGNVTASGTAEFYRVADQ